PPVVQWRTGLPFFFQAEDGIRDRTVTGVQTCALPIYPPAPRLEHRPSHSLERVERPKEVRLEDVAPVLEAHPHDQVVAGDTGVVDEDVDLAKRLDRGLDQRLRGGRIGDVGLNRERLPAGALDPGDRLLCRSLVAA